ncbi:MAG: metallophosphoesterase [Balneolaceae bacterium]
MPDIFLSDLHYGAHDEETDQQIKSDLFSLLDYCEKHHVRIHILGDLFDYWMEYPGDFPEIGKQILKRFEEYHRDNPATLFITGNHDNWTREAFATAGFDVEPEFRILNLEGSLVFLLHGDGLASSEFRLKRPLLHRLIRSSWFVTFFQNLTTPAGGLFLMKYFSRFSRWKSHPDPSRLNRWAKEFLASGRADLILSGHDHVPRVETFDFGTYINVGTFSEDRTAALHTNGVFELVTWDSENRQLLPAGKTRHPELTRTNH